MATTTRKFGQKSINYLEPPAKILLTCKFGVLNSCHVRVNMACCCFSWVIKQKEEIMLPLWRLKIDWKSICSCDRKFQSSFVGLLSVCCDTFEVSFTDCFRGLTIRWKWFRSWSILMSNLSSSRSEKQLSCNLSSRCKIIIIIRKVEECVNMSKVTN